MLADAGRQLKDGYRLVDQMARETLRLSRLCCGYYQVDVSDLYLRGHGGRKSSMVSAFLSTYYFFKPHKCYV